MSILFSILGFFLAIGILVFVHEYGHFKVARLCGVKVRRFSIGFGKPLFQRTDRLGTEWSLGWAPLGGYVLMVDGRNETLQPGEEKVAFDHKPLWARSAIVAAGPLANLLLAFLIFMGLGMYGTHEPKALMGAAVPGSVAAKAGFLPDDLIVSVGGSSVQSISEAHLDIASAAISKSSIQAEVARPDGSKATRSLDFTGFDAGAAADNFMLAVGFPAPGPQVAPVIGNVLPGSPADRAGIKEGDRILSANGSPISLWSELMAAIVAAGEHPLFLSVQAPNGPVRQISATPTVLDETHRPKLGFSPSISAFKDRRPFDFVLVRLGPVDAAIKSAERCESVTAMTLSAIGGMITGKDSVKGISGPVGIAKMAGSAVERGFQPYFNFLAFISLSLFLMNLLPIPALDGGHLLQYGIEGIIRRPLSVAAQHAMAKVGFVILGAMMVLAIGNDILRLFA